MAARLASKLKFAFWWPHAPAFLWALVMAGLPMTSFPLITHLTGSTVAPFSALPLAFLALIWFFPTLLRRASLPEESVPLIFFILWVIVGSALAFFNVTGMFRDKSLTGETIRSLLPLVVGIAFYFITAAWNKDTIRLRRSLQWIHVGGVLMLVYSVAQILVITIWGNKYIVNLNVVGSYFVDQMNLQGKGRIAGLAFEPSWLAHQLNMLYLPLWLAASYLRTTVFPRLGKISVENILLAVGMVAFFFTSPRIGGVACMLMLFYLFLKFNLVIYRWLIHRLSRLSSAVDHSRWIQAGIGALVVLVLVGVYAGSGFGILKIASGRDDRIALLVDSPLSSGDIQTLSKFDENSLMLVGRKFAFLERTVYWMTGWHIFNDYPITGVGLGNAGFYFVENMPAAGWSSIEIRTLMYRDTALPNIKSMWYRLLAETGIVGFMLFIVWLLVLWFSLSASMHSQDNTLRTIALAGQLALLAFVFEGFSVDSFGLPYLFVISGLAAAAGMVYRQRGHAPEGPAVPPPQLPQVK